MDHLAWRAVMTGLVVAVAVLSAGCGPASGSTPARKGESQRGGGAAGYWTRERRLAARPLRGWTLPTLPNRPPGATPSAHPALLPAPRVGALFSGDAQGDHFCTASVVASPGRDLLITAAHCIDDGRGGGYKQNTVFVPDYANGTAPYGVWTPRALLVDPHWAESSDPDYDVGFVVLKPQGGKDIQDVLGANKILFNAGFVNLVRVTGYPSSTNAPVTCINGTSQQSAGQLRFDCGGFPGGTSGSPWIIRFNRRERTGTIVGVIGGYQEGGDTPSISYSVYLSNVIRRLYEQARALSKPGH